MSGAARKSPRSGSANFAACCSRRAPGNSRHASSPTGSSPIGWACASSCSFTRCCRAMSRANKAVVLLSGGLDSATVLALAREQGLECHALSFRYGQRHAIELEAAARVAQALGALEHRVANVDLGWIGGSALTADIAVPKDRGAAEMG